eukprot:6001796-Pleurochrysis_carterae.AAC.1
MSTKLDDDVLCVWSVRKSKKKHQIDQRLHGVLARTHARRLARHHIAHLRRPVEEGCERARSDVPTNAEREREKARR